jgi:hypothetical protein
MGQGSSQVITPGGIRTTNRNTSLFAIFDRTDRIPTRAVSVAADDDLTRLAQLWPRLPEDVRVRIMMTLAEEAAR